MFDNFINYMIPVVGTALGTLLSALFAYLIVIDIPWAIRFLRLAISKTCIVIFFKFLYIKSRSIK